MIFPVRAFHHPHSKPLAPRPTSVAATEVRFGAMSTPPPLGFEYLPAENPKLAKPVYVGYHPDNQQLANQITIALLSNGLSVIRRNWGYRPNITPERQAEWITNQSSHAIVLVTPSYNRNQETINEFSDLHRQAVLSGGLTGEDNAQLLHILRVDNTPILPTLSLPNTTWNVTSATFDVQREIGLIASALTAQS